VDYQGSDPSANRTFDPKWTFARPAIPGYTLGRLAVKASSGLRSSYKRFRLGFL
jgi:hypothetical protein